MRPLGFEPEQRREVEALRKLRVRRLHERACRRRSFRALRIAPLAHGEDRREHCQEEQHGERERKPEQPALTLLRPLELADLRRAARVEKLALRCR